MLLYKGSNQKVWALLSSYIYENYLSNQGNLTIINNSNEVIIEQGDKKIIIPKNVYEHKEIPEKSGVVKEAVSEAFSALKSDEEIIGQTS